MKTKTKMIPACRISITRVEGPVDRCGWEMVFGDWDGAYKWLLSQAYTFPTNGRSHKHDFKVVFEDGETYTGVLDCKKDSDLDVAEHIFNFVSYRAGQRCPAHLTLEEYEQHLQMHEQIKPGSREEAVRWLETYLVGMPVDPSADIADDIEVLWTLEESFRKHETEFVYTRDEYEQAYEYLGELRFRIMKAVRSALRVFTGGRIFLGRVLRNLETGEYQEERDLERLQELYT